MSTLFADRDTHTVSKRRVVRRRREVFRVGIPNLPSADFSEIYSDGIHGVVDSEGIGYLTNKFRILEL